MPTIKPPTRQRGGVYTPWPYWLEQARQQTLAEQAVFGQLQALAQAGDGETCRVGQGALQQRTGIAARKTVVRALRGLAAKSHIEPLTLKPTGGDPTAPCVYRIEPIPGKGLVFEFARWDALARLQALPEQAVYNQLYASPGAAGRPPRA